MEYIMKKPVSKKGKLSNKKGETFNYNNKGYSGAALIIPKKENGGKIDSNTTSDILLKINEFKNSVPEYIYNGYINSGLELQDRAYNKQIAINKYPTGGKIIPYDPKDRKFKEWYNKNTLEGQNKIPYSERLDYDYYSFYKNGEYRNKMFNIENHFPDTYKRPNHKTFSNESIYSTRENPGGIWRGEEFVPRYDPGGTAGPYQMIQPSIYPQNYGINSPYFSQQPPLFDGQVGSPYYSTHDDYSQYGITNNIQPIPPKGLKKLQIPSPSEYPSNTLDRISRDLMQRDPLAKSTPSTSAESIGSEVAGIDNGIGSDGKGDNGRRIPRIDPISAARITKAANVASATYDTTNMLMQNLSKEDSATRGWADASTRATKYADAVTSIVKDIPVVGPVARAVGKTLSFWIAGPAGARSANIRKKEMKYTTDLNEFNERNSQTVLAPNNYNNYRAEFGINTGTKNNPLIEEILNDFRNYLAQIQNT